VCVLQVLECSWDELLCVWLGRGVRVTGVGVFLGRATVCDVAGVCVLQVFECSWDKLLYVTWLGCACYRCWSVPGTSCCVWRGRGVHVTGVGVFLGRATVCDVARVCVLQVLECSWDELLHSIKQAEDLDHIIAAHQEFLDAITARSLLDPQSHVSHSLQSAHQWTCSCRMYSELGSSGNSKVQKYGNKSSYLHWSVNLVENISSNYCIGQ